MFDNRREIMQDVFLTYLPAQRFKTSRMTVQLIAPLQRETAAANALLPAVLRRGTVRCPDMESLSAALDTLYGANIDYTVRKKGERQCVGFAAGFIDDAFTPHGEKLLEPVSAMLGELLLDPVTHGGRFLSSYVESEKANLIDAIRGLKNDKRDWADIRLMQEMCAGEPYSVLRLGDEETAGRITNQSLYVHGQALMASSQPNRPARMKKVAGTTITPMSTWNRSVMVVAHRPETKVNTMMTAKIIAVMARRFQPVKAENSSTASSAHE